MVPPRLARTLDPAWLAVPPVRVGPDAGSPIAYALAEVPGGRLRVDVHAAGPDAYAFEDVIAWEGSLVVGIGSFVHLVRLADRRCATVALGAYFGSLHPRPDCLLVASAERVFRIEADHSVRWRSAPVGIDGVVLHDCGAGPHVEGDGEWDPPGGWEPFVLDVETGETLAVGGG